MIQLHMIRPLRRRLLSRNEIPEDGTFNKECDQRIPRGERVRNIPGKDKNNPMEDG